jgi:hypothetical protein
MRNDLSAEAGYSKWLPNCGARFLIGAEKSLTYRRNKREPPEAAVVQEKQVPVEVSCIQVVTPELGFRSI